MPYAPMIPPRTFRPDGPDYSFGFATDDWRPELPPPEEWIPPELEGDDPPSPYNPYLPEKKDEGLSTGAKVAIGVGVVAAGAALWYALK